MSQQTNNKSTTPVLELAWRRYAELSANASDAQKRHFTLRRWVIILSVVATLLAILSGLVNDLFPQQLVINETLRILLVIVPIAGSVVLTFANKFQQGERWLALRAGAEEIKKEIFLYRTILQGQENRHHWLTERVAEIQRQVLEAVGGELVLKPLTATGSDIDEANRAKAHDKRLTDLLPDEYMRDRLQDQLGWHERKIVHFQKERTRLQALVYVFGGAGSLLAALGGVFNIWVALTASLAAALTAWLELRQNNAIINNYSLVILELKIIQDHWLGLSLEERTGDEFFKLVIATEKVLWSQHNKFLSEMRKAVAELRGESKDSLDEVAQMPASAAIDEAILQQAQAAGREPETEETPPEEEEQIKRPQGAPHAFVVMPFGQKQGPDGRWIDFDSIYQQLIKPALMQSGFKPFRADEETISGDILTDMFQELLLADLVVADLSIDNANAFYELGARHALRKRGVVHIQSGRAYLPFDIFNVRTIPYHCGANGKPDPKYLKKDIEMIAKVAYDTWNSNHERVHSPIFNLLDGLSEPDRKDLRTPLATGYWREYREWEQRVDIARRQGFIGDVLLLTEEVRNPHIREEVISEAAKALSDMGHHHLALQQYRRGLDLNASNFDFRREEAFELGRIKRRDEALVKLERLLQDNPGDCEAIAFMGRLYKDMWVEAWREVEDEQVRRKTAYESAFLLKKSIATYLAAYSLDQNHFYSGINGLTLSMLLDYLDEQLGEQGDTDPEIEAIRQQLPPLSGAVQFSAAQTAARSPNDFWAFASLADVSVNVADSPKAVVRAYQKALAAAGKNTYSIKSTLGQLKLLDRLGFRPAYVQAGISLLQSALDELYKAEEETIGESDYNPVKVFLCAGHMIDHPDRPEPRFPPGMESEAQQKIEQALEKLEADSNDMIITPGIACGGDILFIEACLQRGLKVEVYLPFAEARFIEESVSFAGDDWVERFYQIHQEENVTIHLQPDRLGDVPDGDNPFERNNRWALYSTLCYGIERVRLIVLWNGKGGDGPGGTGHMVKEVRQLGGIVEHIDTTKFDYWQEHERVEAVTT